MIVWSRFNHSEDVSGYNQAKSSVVRGIRAKIIECYPTLEPYINDILPKKEPVNIMKWFVVCVCVCVCVS